MTDEQNKKTYKHIWTFPLHRTHTGMLLGNGVMGVMIWGESNILRITFNRGDFWDHRGGRKWQQSMTFSAIRKCLEANDKAGIRQIFHFDPAPAGKPERSSILPLGRVELHFDPSCTLQTGELNMSAGIITITLRDNAERTHILRAELAMDRPLLHIQLPATLSAPMIRPVTAWDYPNVERHLEAISVQRPQMFSHREMSGWVQARPAQHDQPICVGWQVNSDQHELSLALDYGNTPADAQASVQNLVGNIKHEELRTQNQTWWNAYWADVPQIHVPDDSIRFLYHYGMYKFAGLTTPGGVAAGLQGPWIEEYQMPPWSGDYHFNINVQMCYQPAFAGNRLAHLRPLFDLLDSWMPILRENARMFVGVEDGLVLPHAVNDKCEFIGTFWAGCIDQACTAWVGKLMYDYWLFGGGDDLFLRDRVYPFLSGAMRVYEALLERRPDGTFTLPISVSPEYRGSEMNAWGCNASFQLACIHWLLGALSNCCQNLNIAPKHIWAEISAGLPQATMMDTGKDGRHIALWQGTDLEESHRHHSHLGAITPFETIDPQDPAWQDIVSNSINNWVRMGMGLWTGWCIPWAVMLHHRVGNPDMALMLIEIWRRVFTNIGHGTLHDCNFPGLTLMGIASKERGEIMQMDAGMGMTAAIMDGLAHVRQGKLHLFTGAPLSWRDVSFDNIRLPGAFLVSASRRDGVIQEIRLFSERDNSLRFQNPWPQARIVHSNRSPLMTSEAMLHIQASSNETITIEPHQVT